MDTLSEVLAICRAERAVTARFHLSSPWGLHSNGVSGSAMIRMARGAPWWIEAVGGNGPVRVEPGDLVMMPLGAAHRMGSTPDAPTVPFAQLLTQRTPGSRDEAPLDLRHGGGGDHQLRFIGGGLAAGRQRQHGGGNEQRAEQGSLHRDSSGGVQRRV